MTTRGKKIRAKVDRGETDRGSTIKSPATSPATGPTLTQSKGDILLKRLFFSGLPLPIVIEPDPAEPKEVIKRPRRSR
jgi:hypothetical protein